MCGVYSTFYFPERFSVIFPIFEIQPIITLEGSISHMFHREGKNKVTVQVACGSTVMQDSKVITVKGEWGKKTDFKALYLELHEYAIWYFGGGTCNVSRSALRAVPCVCQRRPT